MTSDVEIDRLRTENGQLKAQLETATRANLDVHFELHMDDTVLCEDGWHRPLKFGSADEAVDRFGGSRLVRCKNRKGREHVEVRLGTEVLVYGEVTEHYIYYFRTPIRCRTRAEAKTYVERGARIVKIRCRRVRRSLPHCEKTL